jgi:hypothetical protein
VLTTDERGFRYKEVKTATLVKAHNFLDYGVARGLRKGVIFSKSL